MSDQFVFRTFLFFSGDVNLLQTFVQSAQMNPRQVVGFVSPLRHYQGQLKGSGRSVETAPCITASFSRHGRHQFCPHTNLHDLGHPIGTVCHQWRGTRHSQGPNLKKMSRWYISGLHRCLIKIMIINTNNNNND